MTATTAAALPAVTRMLLASDGSTTYLLEAMLATGLRVVVDEQRHDLTGAAVPAGVVRALGITAGDTVLVRTSRLVTGDGSTVSRNVVTARWPLVSAIAEIITDRTAPIGPALRDAGVTQTRRILHSGVTRWPSGGSAACKEYLISGPVTPAVHIHETFNPRFVPTGDVAVHATPGQ